MGAVRFILALSVVVAHWTDGKLLGIQLLSGVAAVQCFYIISGFLITMVINENRAYESTSAFYISRYLRLWPMYIVVATLTYVLFRAPMFENLAKIADHTTVAFVAFSNFTIFFQDWFLFLTFDHGHVALTEAFALMPPPQVNSYLIVPQAWTLGVELTFYAIAPIACRSPPRIFLLTALGVCSRLIVASYHPPAPDPWLYRFAPSEMMLFGSGGIAYFIGRWLCPRFPHLTNILCAASVIALYAVALGVFDIRGYISHKLILYDWPILLLMAVAAPSLYYGTAKLAIDRALGELSYPMYLCHVFVGSAVREWIPAQLQEYGLFYAIVVVVFSVILLLIIGRPIDVWRHTFTPATSRITA